MQGPGVEHEVKGKRMDMNIHVSGFLMEHYCIFSVYKKEGSSQNRNGAGAWTPCHIRGSGTQCWVDSIQRTGSYSLLKHWPSQMLGTGLFSSCVRTSSLVLLNIIWEPLWSNKAGSYAAQSRSQLKEAVWQYNTPSMINHPAVDILTVKMNHCFHWHS